MLGLAAACTIIAPLMIFGVGILSYAHNQSGRTLILGSIALLALIFVDVLALYWLSGLVRTAGPYSLGAIELIAGTVVGGCFLLAGMDVYISSKD